MTFRPKIVVLLGFQFLRLWANFGVYFMLKANVDMKSFYLVEKILDNLSLSI